LSLLNNPVPDGIYPASIAADSHVGLVREINEDSYAYFAGAPSSETIALVADGIGGHERGDVASHMCSQVIIDSWRCVASRGGLNENSSRQFLYDEIRKANEKLFAVNSMYNIQHPMGTTVVAAVFLEGAVVVAHAGDSRCYRLRDDALTALTFDHSFVAELVRKNVITPEEAPFHPFAHIISKSVGPIPDIQPEINSYDRKSGDRFVLCSDGLTNHVDDKEIESILKASEYPHEAVRKLMNASLQKGGEDNITIVCVFA